MAQTGRMTNSASMSRRPMLQPVTRLRIAIIVLVLSAWEAVAASGLLYRDVVPSLFAIGKSLFELLTVPDMPVRIDVGLFVFRIDQTVRIPQVYWHLYTTCYEIIVGTVIGGLAGLIVGIALGGSRILRRAFQTMLYYFCPVPKILFFPGLIDWFWGRPSSQNPTEC